MAFDPRFTTIVPPLTETFSHDSTRPCRFEKLAHHHSSSAVACPFQGDCPNLAQTLPLKYLHRAYQSDVAVTLAEPSSSIVVRSEHQYTDDVRHRFSIRKHLYELLSGPLPGGDPLDCLDLPSDAMFGDYLGFVDLRAKCNKSPIAFGLLVPPRRYRVDPQAQVITGVYGPLFGSHGFDASVYSMQDPDLSGARCAHACAIMALGMLSDRGGQILGSYTLTCLAKNPPLDPRTLDEAGRDLSCLRMSEKNLRGVFHVGNLQVEETLKLLAQPECGVSPFHVDLLPSDSPRIAKRLLEAYIAARFPVILAVHNRTWYAPFNPKKPPADTGHAVVVIGIRQCARDGDAVSLIVHDPGFMPFLECQADHCFESAYAYYEGQGAQRKKGHLHMIPVADTRVVQDAAACLKSLRDDPRFQPYCNAGSSGSDFRIRLLRAQEVSSLFPVRVALDARQALVKRLHDWCGLERHWCIAGYAGNVLSVLWIFPADRRDPRHLIVTIDQTFNVQVRLSTPRDFAPPVRADVIATAKTDSCETAAAREAKQYRPLDVSVITSSSTQPLCDLLHELKSISHVNLVDLMILRDEELSVLGRTPQDSLVDCLEKATCVGPIVEWVQREIGGADFMVPALATYFPQITSRVAVSRGRACSAVANCLRIAKRLQGSVMNYAIAEVVCGTLYDRCPCHICGPTSDGTEPIYASSLESKLVLLRKSLEAVFADLGSEARGAFVALELEPGFTYVLQNHESLRLLKTHVLCHPSLEGRVGLNVDVAHMRIAQVPIDSLRELKDYILHAHIADHPPYMHTRDQVVGAWTNVECDRDGGYYPYLRLLSEINAECQDGKRKLPFSGSVAVELEGCARIAWVHQSVATLRHLLQAACRP